MNEKKINIFPLAVGIGALFIILLAILLDFGTFLVVVLNIAGLVIGAVCLVAGCCEFMDEYYGSVGDGVYLIIWGVIFIVGVIFLDKLVMAL